MCYAKNVNDYVSSIIWNDQVVLSATVVQEPEGAGLGRGSRQQARGRDTAGRRGRLDRREVGIRLADVVVWTQAYSRGLGGLGES